MAAELPLGTNLVGSVTVGAYGLLHLCSHLSSAFLQEEVEEPENN